MTMASASWELQKAVHGALTGDTALVALLGGARIYDDVPRGAEFPYVTFGPATVRDWSTGTETAAEHLFSLNVWCRSTGEREVQLILEAVRAALHDAALSVDGHRLVNLRHEISDAGRQSDGETYHGVIRLRAVTEPTS
jgi:uncharacterized protein DUF3168